uniref:DUF7726 domain-containing protein n=1 Tax=Kwoniella dejecticola CBS 10117 TaxID=1296121 RepID=A0A1A6A8K2_9TREE|nr:uncharacterized protein I303_04104 [Kwoniella dejecticola CBS 10117]OBR86380.1 hypothetical protein I303_04104 [Kwoniella dejecticola CBS 10117]
MPPRRKAPIRLPLAEKDIIDFQQSPNISTSTSGAASKTAKANTRSSNKPQAKGRGKGKPEAHVASALTNATAPRANKKRSREEADLDMSGDTDPEIHDVEEDSSAEDDDFDEQEEEEDQRLPEEKDPSFLLIKYNFHQCGRDENWEFQEAIGVNSRSYLNFMRQSGPSAGSGSDTYSAAHIFFVQKEREDYKIPRANSKKATSSKTKTTQADTNPTKTTANKKSKTSTSSSKDTAKENDVSEITLEGEGSLKLPVYDTSTM